MILYEILGKKKGDILQSIIAISAIGSAFGIGFWSACYLFSGLS